MASMVAAGNGDSAPAESGQRGGRQILARSRPDGDSVWLEVTLAACPGGGQLVIFIDITEAQTQKVRLERMTQMYAALSQVNQAIVWSPTRDVLLARICEVMVEFGKFTLAWVGLNDPVTHRVAVVSSHGDVSGYLDDLEIRSDESPQGQGATGRAIRTGHSCVVNDFLGSQDCSPWHERAAGANLAASASFPIRTAGQVVGALTIYASQRNFFRTHEIALLEEAAGDISFALDHLESETRRMEAEKDLRESRERLQRAESVAAFGNWEVNLATGVTRASMGAHLIYGIRDGELSLAEVQERVLPEDRPRLDAALRDLVERGLAYNVDFRIRRAEDGELRTIHSVAEYDPGKRVVFGVLHDITERKKVEDELRDRESVFRDFFYNSRVAISMTTLDGLLRANRAYCQIVGYTEEELNRTRWQDITHPDDLAVSTENVNAVITRAKEAASWEKRYIRKDGSIALVDMHISLRRDDWGQPLFFITTISDITATRQATETKARLEAQLLQSQKLESLGRLAGGVAHDINNMLAATMGHMELMRLENVRNDNIQFRLDQMQKAVERSRDIIRQLLAFSRKQVIEPQILGLNAHIEETRKALAPLLGEDLKFSFQPGPGLWDIRADPTQVDQVLMNLTINARDAMPEGGPLSISTRNIRLDEAACLGKPEFLPGRYVLLSVSDGGCGMSPEVLARIFDPFFTTKEEGRGTGLGLSTVFGIAKQSGGFIDVYSEPGHGTTFKIYFPAHSALRQEATPAATWDGPATGGRILVVEDDEVLQTVIPQMVEKLGYTVRQARSAREAIQIDWDAEGPFDLLLTDVVMPGMSGRELSEHFRALHPELKVLFMSGYTADIITRNGVLEEGNYFIAKPFSLASLGGKLAALIAPGHASNSD